MTAKEEFIQIYNENIKREGAKDLLWFLENSDFFTAPASTKFHSAYTGGLCEHSIKVYKRLLKLIQNEYGDKWQEQISSESIAICGLLHDICKVNTYKIDYRNVKENNVWTKKEVFIVDDSLPYGHGEKSVYMINGFMKLNRQEAMMINWHMGAYDLRVKGGSFALSDVYYTFPNVLLMNIADVEASYLDETTEKYSKQKTENNEITK